MHSWQYSQTQPANGGACPPYLHTQKMALRLGGKLLYSPVDSVLQIVWDEADELPRYRCVMRCVHITKY